jgi:hypothetical protein
MDFNLRNILVTIEYQIIRKRHSIDYLVLSRTIKLTKA